MLGEGQVVPERIDLQDDTIRCYTSRLSKRNEPCQDWRTCGQYPMSMKASDMFESTSWPETKIWEKSTWASNELSAFGLSSDQSDRVE